MFTLRICIGARISDFFSDCNSLKWVSSGVANSRDSVKGSLAYLSLGRLECPPPWSRFQCDEHQGSAVEPSVDEWSGVSRSPVPAGPARPGAGTRVIPLAVATGTIVAIGGASSSRLAGRRTSGGLIVDKLADKLAGEPETGLWWRTFTPSHTHIHTQRHASRVVCFPVNKPDEFDTCSVCVLSLKACGKMHFETLGTTWNGLLTCACVFLLMINFELYSQGWWWCLLEYCHS